MRLFISVYKKKEYSYHNKIEIHCIHCRIDDDGSHFQSTEGPSTMESQAKRSRPSEDLRHALGTVCIMIIHYEFRFISCSFIFSSLKWPLEQDLNSFHICLACISLESRIFSCIQMLKRKQSLQNFHLYFIHTERRHAASKPEGSSSSAARAGNPDTTSSRFGNRQKKGVHQISALNFAENREHVLNNAWDKGMTPEQVMILKEFFQKFASHRARCSFYESRYCSDDLSVKPLANNIRGGGRGRGRGNEGRGNRGGYGPNGQVKALMD